jgi:hypothetical protein
MGRPSDAARNLGCSTPFSLVQAPAPWTALEDVIMVEEVRRDEYNTGAVFHSREQERR